MKQNGAVYNLETKDRKDYQFHKHYPTISIETPLHPEAFNLTDDEKIKLIGSHFRSIMNILGLDLADDSLSETPGRVAKMYVKEFFSGLNPANKPAISLFENKYNYDRIIIEKNITFYSTCEHHFVPIMGKAHIGYISSGKVIGLSKLNRIVQYFAQRPQVQERLTLQIAQELRVALNTQDVAIVIDAAHLCVAARGIKDSQSSMITSEFCGVFQEPDRRNEFMSLIK